MKRNISTRIEAESFTSWQKCLQFCLTKCKKQAMISGRIRIEKNGLLYRIKDTMLSIMINPTVIIMIQFFLEVFLRFFSHFVLYHLKQRKKKRHIRSRAATKLGESVGFPEKGMPKLSHYSTKLRFLSSLNSFKHQLGASITGLTTMQITRKKILILDCFR